MATAPASPPPRRRLLEAAEIVERKKRAECGVTPEPGLPSMRGRHYLDLLAELHRRRRPRTYLEIGSESGASLSLAGGRVIAVDPAMRLAPGALSRASEAHLFARESDDFFAEGFLDRLGAPVDMAFLDGMHLFEFLLRDFINAERAMAAGGIILMHDCAPMSRAAARRKWDRSVTIFWCGDVWKLLPILREHRPDLNLRFWLCPPSGLAVVDNPDPSSTVLRDRYDEIVSRWTKVTLEDFGIDAFAALVENIAAGELTADR